MTLLVLFNFFWKYFNACKIIIFYEYIIINLTIFLLLDILVLPWTSFFFSMNIFIHTVWTAASVCPQSRLTLCNLMTVAHEAPHPWNSPGKNTVVLGRHFLLQGFFPTQELNLCLLCLLHCRQILYHWAIGEVLFILYSEYFLNRECMLDFSRCFLCVCWDDQMLFILIY